MKRILFSSYTLTALIFSSLMFQPLIGLAHGTELTNGNTSSLPQTEQKEELPSTTYSYNEKHSMERNDWLLFGNVSASYLRSYLDGGGSSLSGGNVNGVLIPGYRLTDRLLASVMYSGQYYKKRDYYSDQVGPRLRTEHQNHTITPMLRYYFGRGNRYSIRPSFFFTRTYNKDVAGGDWNDGLYNYKDIGGGLDFDMRLDPSDTASGTFRCGLQYYHREYPNFTSLLDLASEQTTALGAEKDERDYDGILFRTSYSSNKAKNLRWALEYYFLFKQLDDKKVVRSDGVLSSAEEEDFLQSLTLRLSYFPPRHTNLRLGLDLNTSKNSSNQNYYDGMGSLLLSDDVYMNDYYDYFSYQVRPNLSYSFTSLPLNLHLAYAFQRVDFSDRLAQDRNGNYKDDKQYENQQVVAVRLEYPTLKNLVTFTEWEYLDVTSNNDNEHIYHYNHRVQTWQIGISYTF